MKKKTLNEWVELWHDAVSKRASIDERIKRRYELYNGTDKVRDLQKGGYSKKKAYTLRNLTYELIETQINNSIPQPKVTPRNPGDMELAQNIEGYLKSESDRLEFEVMNDEAERECLIQGTVFYYVGWDNYETTPITEGELTVKVYPLSSVYPQPGIKDFKDAEYIFVKDMVSVDRIRKIYGKKIPEGDQFRGMNTIITAWYLNDDGFISRFGWVENSEIVVFDESDYELRRFRECSDCGERVPRATVCPVCGSTHFTYKPSEYEILDDDIVKLTTDTTTGESEQVTLANAGSSIEYYKIRQLPFVRRVNISSVKDVYGVSDADMLEESQESSNKLLTKMQENVLKGGSIVTIPTGCNVPVDDETLKVVKVKDVNQMKAFSVNSIQASIQQEDILQDRTYNFGRNAVGITDAYQGKRDTTAESGKAKEIAAAQSSGRLESKRRMKDAAYANLYELMFKFLLAYCDEKRVYARVEPTGEYVEGNFNRYNFLDGKPGDIYYNDRFLFSVDNASTLSTNREAMWQETTTNFQAGTFGNPADPKSLMLYWNTMKELGYPLAKQALASLRQRTQELPIELQQVIMQNPEMMEQLMAMAGAEENGNTEQ